MHHPIHHHNSWLSQPHSPRHRGTEPHADPWLELEKQGSPLGLLCPISHSQARGPGPPPPDVYRLTPRRETRASGCRASFSGRGQRRGLQEEVKLGGADSSGAAGTSPPGGCARRELAGCGVWVARRPQPVASGAEVSRDGVRSRLATSNRASGRWPHPAPSLHAPPPPASLSTLPPPPRSAPEGLRGGRER